MVPASLVVGVVPGFGVGVVVVVSSSSSSVVEEATRPMGYGGRMSPATIIALAGKEADLGDITDVYDTLYLFRLDGGRVVSLEEEYSNISADLRVAPREALLAACRRMAQ